MIRVAEGKECCFVAAQYANKGELVLCSNAYVQKKSDMIHCNTEGDINFKHVILNMPKL